MSRLIVLTAILSLLVGCDSRQSSSSGSKTSDSETAADSKDMAGKMDQFAVEELAKAKNPGKAWLMDTTHDTFKAEKAKVLKLTDDVLAAGAAGVWVGESEELEGQQLIDHLFVELPADSSKRAKVFEVYNKDSMEYGSPEKDSGQKFLVFDWG